MKCIHWIKFALVVAITATIIAIPGFTKPALADESEAKANAALEKLYAKSEVAKLLEEKATGILVFPSIVKGGFIVGGQYGKGSLLKEGKLSGEYNTIQASYGLQAGLQEYAYALFFMTDSALKYLEESSGWELGVGPTIAIVNVGAAKSFTTTTAKSEIYAFFFDTKGMMAGLGIQGTKITKLD